MPILSRHSFETEIAAAERGDKFNGSHCQTNLGQFGARFPSTLQPSLREVIYAYRLISDRRFIAQHPPNWVPDNTARKG